MQHSERSLMHVQVREGRALAPGMDPEAELKTLRLRFDNFRRDFKVSRHLCLSVSTYMVLLSSLAV